ncbi:MAG: hypothetical protein OEV62_12255 [Actinomycetota bacterium]|nr:hypothetical protein [Actinomycetota bacterium]
MTDDRSPLELRDIAHRLSGAVYGTILATAVVVAASGYHAGGASLAVIVAVTSLVFWLAHVYSESIGARMVLEHSLSRHQVLEVARGEWPMLQSSVPVLIPLVLAWMGVFSQETGAWLAVVVGVGALFTYGWLIGRRENLGRWRTLLSAFVTGSFGLVVLVLKVVVH